MAVYIEESRHSPMGSLPTVHYVNNLDDFLGRHSPMGSLPTMKCQTKFFGKKLGVAIPLWVVFRHVLFCHRNGFISPRRHSPMGSLPTEPNSHGNELSETESPFPYG